MLDVVLEADMTAPSDQSGYFSVVYSAPISALYSASCRGVDAAYTGLNVAEYNAVFQNIFGFAAKLHKSVFV